MYSVPLSYLVTILQIKLLFLEGSTSGFCFSVSFTFSYAVRKKKTITNASYTCSLQGKNTS